VRPLIRLEELGLFVSSIYLFSWLHFAWWYFPLLFFLPDLSIAAYAAGPRVGPPFTASSIIGPSTCSCSSLA